MDETAIQAAKEEQVMAHTNPVEDNQKEKAEGRTDREFPTLQQQERA